MKHTRIIVPVILGAAIALVWLLAAIPTQAARSPSSISVTQSISVTTTADEFGTGSQCSLREAVQAINTAASFGGCTYTAGDNTIQLIDETYDLTITGTGDDANATGDIDIIAPMTILGSGGSAVDAHGIERVFQIHASAVAVTFDSVEIRNGGNTGYGGGIFCREADLTLVDSTIRDNSGTWGGGVYIDDGGNLAVTNTVILSNTASKHGGGVYIAGGNAIFSQDSWVAFNSVATFSGGGISVDEGSLTINNGRVVGNHADNGDGGGIYAYASSLVINNSQINENSAEEYGGGLVLFNDNTLVLRGGEVMRNSAENGGGVALFFTSTLTQTQMNVIAYNDALTGGGVYLMTANATLESGRVMSNTAMGGGGVYLGSSSVLTQVGASQIVYNHAMAGGGVYVDDSHALLSGGQIISNTGNLGGGVYIFAGGVVRVDDGRIMANDSDSGGGVFIGSGGVMTQTNGSLIANNDASDNGGGVYIDGGSFLLAGGAVAGNTADEMGGGIHLSNAEDDAGTFEFTGGLIAGNSAEGGGGLYANEGSASLSGGEILGNEAYHGGGLYLNGVLLDEIGAAIYENTADAGGGVYVAYDSVISGASIYSNTATFDGGGLYVQDGVTIISNTLLAGNSAGASGGGAYIVMGNVTISQTDFTANNASEGGGLVVGSGIGRGDDGAAASHRQELDPPAGEQVSLYRVKIADNVAATTGGGLFMEGTDTDIAASYCRIEDNTAEFGGGIYADYGDGQFSNLHIVGNTADRGGGVFVHSGYIQFANLTLHDNQATVSNGGGVFADGGITTFGYSTITNNSAAAGAGGIHKAPTALAINPNNSILANNTPQNCNAELFSSGFNIDSGNTCGFNFTGDQHNTSPILGPLANNGGGTLTRALLHGSPAIDAGQCVAERRFDQRGFPRPNPNSSFCDIGAFEANTGGLTDLSITKFVTPDSAAPGEPITYTLVYTHSGPSGAVQVTLEDIIPSGVTVLEVTSVGADIWLLPGSQYIWKVDDLAPHSGGVITISGVLNVPLAAGIFTNTVTISCSAVDPDPSNNTAEAALTVQPVAPVALDNSYTTAEDTPLSVVAPGVLSNDTDANGDTLAAELDSSPLHGALTLNPDGSFTYTPAQDYIGEDTFTYHASDGTMDSNVVTVTINVGAANDAPTAEDDEYTTNEDTLLTVNAPGVLSNDTDPDGDTLIAVLDTSPTHGALAFNADGSFEYTPNADYNGSDSFTYHASDGSLDSVVVAVTLDIAPVNDAPLTADDSYIAGMNIPLAVAAPGVLANDSDAEGDSLTALLDIAPPTGELSLLADGSFVFTPTQDYTGTVYFYYHVSDGLLDSPITEAVITITEMIADLSVSKSVDISAPTAGGTIVYSIVITNSGPDGATGVVVEDALPMGVTYVSDDSSGAFDQASGRWAAGSLGAGESVTLHITVTVNADAGGTTITNTVTVAAAGQYDPDTSDDSDSVEITVAEAEYRLYLPVVCR